MTDYFEVHERDGPARLGEVRLADPLRTPGLVDEVLDDSGSRWPEERDVLDGDESTLTVLPHRAFPAGTDERVADAFATDYPDVEFPSVAVVSRDTAADYGADAYALSEAAGIAGHAAAFVETVLDVRGEIPPDSALYCSGLATPANVATLAYAGVDLFDTDKAYVRGLEGFYLTTDGEAFLEDLDELPCACAACQQSRETFDHEDCAEHNVNALRAELARVRQRIRGGRLRDYVEGQARHEAWLTATFRRLDQQYGYVEQRTPILRRDELLAASDDSLKRVEIQRFADRVTSRYHNRFDGPLVLVPCSARKPYGDSQSHAQFHKTIGYRGHKVSMTSPIGVVPQELELTYPAQHYDSVVTGEWSESEVEFVAEVLARYLDATDYPRHVAHVPPGGYTDIVERAVERCESDVEFEFTVGDHPTTDESLAALDETLEGEERYLKREREHNTVRAIADYQFGAGGAVGEEGAAAGDAFFDHISTGGRYPSLRVNSEGEQWATLVPQYGTLSLTLEGAKRWVDSDVPTKTVEIDGFVPQGSVLAPGILDADADIRVGEEVVVEGPRAFAVGRASMAGDEMVRSTRGIAVDVRHVEER
ncbi:archaeosine synthase subunit alpha [Halomarina rubra]|uniref:Archaeosine synthase subunit alpha n=1 Tax=Halomarina rubra TaxID=2071873 RepID=A0ABD6AXG2_9EURY|nr:archaeosine synthase subunit alpha [Halomarina rubra]